MYSAFTRLVLIYWHFHWHCVARVPAKDHAFSVAGFESNKRVYADMLEQRYLGAVGEEPTCGIDAKPRSPRVAGIMRFFRKSPAYNSQHSRYESLRLSIAATPACRAALPSTTLPP
jgi:hypothetical protein